MGLKKSTRKPQGSLCLVQDSNPVPIEYKLYHSLAQGHAVAQLVEALRYKPEVREFDS